MKRLLRSLLLGAILSALLCVGVLAADSESVKGGIYNITGSVTLAPKDASGSSIPAGTDTSISGAYYANAVKFDVKAENLTENQQYLLLVLKGEGDKVPSVPTADNIAYIDQMAATGASVDFTAYPKELTKGKYYVYLVGGGTAFAQSQVASFEYDKKYTLGDVNEDGEIDSRDALRTLRGAAGIITLTPNQAKAADVNKDNEIDSRDALRILRYVANLITEF